MVGIWVPEVHSPPLAGPDAPTPARIGTCRPMGRSHFSFGGERKVCKRKPAARRLREKGFSMPILTAGLAMSRAMELARLRLLSCALGARLFPPSKWAGLFPSAAYRRSAPSQLAAGRLTPCGLGCFVVARLLCRTKMKTFVSHTVGDERACPLWGNGLLLLGRFWKVSGQRVWGARAMRPVAEWRSESANRQGASPDRRAARPVAERR